MKVLIGSLARLLRGLAEMLGRWAAPAPQPLPAWSPMPPAGAPEDWLRRALPPPPAHWLAVVRARAPHFQLLDPRAPRAPQPAPSFSPLPRPKEVPTTAPRDRAPKIDAPPFPPARRPIAVPMKSPSVTPRRVVTTVEEQSPRTQRRPDEPVAMSFRKKESSTEPSPRSTLHRAPGVPWPALQLVRETPTPPVETEVVIERPPAELSAGADAPSLETTASPNCQTKRDNSKKPFCPVLSDNSAGPSAHGMPSLSEPGAAWPSLPDAPEERPEDVCRALLREARIEDELAREQRGMPWNA